MSMKKATMDALYYPFSRCISPSSLKQILLVFDRVTFLDPVDDEGWRAKLYRDLERREDARFSSYRDIHRSILDLMVEGIVARADPEKIRLLNSSATAAAAVSDLLDPDWTNVGASPARFQMPHRTWHGTGAATWQVFSAKLPPQFVTALLSDDEMSKHLLDKRDSHEAWTLSYAAGSAAAINAHLAAAEELGLAPVTDSEMHHQLLVRKLLRSQGGDKPKPLGDDLVEQLAQKIVLDLIGEVLPIDVLDEVAFEQIVRFRQATADLRQSLMNDVSGRLGLLTKIPEMGEVAVGVRQIEIGLRDELRKYQAEFTAARKKFWPQVVSSPGSGLATGSLAAVAMSYIGGPWLALAGSIVAASLVILKSHMDVKVEQEKLSSSSSPSVSYVSRLKGEFGRA